MNVFISRPNWSDPEFELGLENFLKFVVGLDLIPRTLGVTDYPTRSPLDEVIDILDN